MRLRDFPAWLLFIIAGAATFAVLYPHFVETWEYLYAGSRVPGLRLTIMAGVLEPWFGNVPHHLRLTTFVLFGLALLGGFYRAAGGVWGTFSLWVGVMVPLTPVLTARSLLSESDLETITETELSLLALGLEGIRVFAPIAAGMFVAFLLFALGRILTS